MTRFSFLFFFLILSTPLKVDWNCFFFFFRHLFGFAFSLLWIFFYHDQRGAYKLAFGRCLGLGRYPKAYFYSAFCLVGEKIQKKVSGVYWDRMLKVVAWLKG